MIRMLEVYGCDTDELKSKLLRATLKLVNDERVILNCQIHNTAFRVTVFYY